MNDIAFILLKIAITICALVITVYIVPYIRTLREDKKYQALLDMVALMVRAAEQTVTGSGQGEVKKERVINFMREWMESMGIEITQAQLSELIEAAVYVMHGEYHG